MENVTALKSKALTRPCMPDSLARRLVDETYWNGEDTVERGGWTPSPIPESQRPVAEQTLADLDDWLAPAPRNWITGRIVTLLAHYWTPQMPEDLQAAVGMDWADILGDYPRHAIECACRTYLETDTRARPTPGQIATIAKVEIEKQAKQQMRLRRCLELEGQDDRYRDLERGGVKSLSSITREEVLAFSAKVKAELRAQP